MAIMLDAQVFASELLTRAVQSAILEENYQGQFTYLSSENPAYVINFEGIEFDEENGEFRASAVSAQYGDTRLFSLAPFACGVMLAHSSLVGALQEMGASVGTATVFDDIGGVSATMSGLEPSDDGYYINDASMQANGSTTALELGEVVFNA